MSANRNPYTEARNEAISALHTALDHLQQAQNALLEAGYRGGAAHRLITPVIEAARTPLAEAVLEVERERREDRLNP